MRLTVLGSGTLVPDDRRRSAAHLLEGEGFGLLMDCGFGTVHGFDRHGVDPASITHLAITHYHTDHVGDVAALLFVLKHVPDPPRETPLVVLGPPGIRRFMEALAAAHGDFVLDPGFPVEVVELARKDRWDDPADRFSLATCPTPHTDVSLAYRVETDRGTVGYTGDTGPSGELAAFLEGCDALVCECAHPDPIEFENHLTPETVAELARTARPSRLLLTHLFPTLDRDAVPDLVAAAGYIGHVAVAEDGTSVEIPLE